MNVLDWMTVVVLVLLGMAVVGWGFLLLRWGWRLFCDWLWPPRQKKPWRSRLLD